jgi:hypothetical protein
MPGQSEAKEWIENRLDVLHQLTYLTDEVQATRKDLNTHDKENIEHFGELKTEIALLKLKASIWGGVGGGIAMAVVQLAAAYFKAH